MDLSWLEDVYWYKNCFVYPEALNCAFQKKNNETFLNLIFICVFYNINLVYSLINTH